MKNSSSILFWAILLSLGLMGCASKKRKGGEPGALSKFYHNTTAYYNGYFNAKEIMLETYLKLENAHSDNYNEIISVYDYQNVPDPKFVASELDRAIEKVTRVAALHEPSKWVDDCYVLMGEAQYLKQDFETAEETFTYFKEEFNPANPFGRNYKKKKKNPKEIREQKEEERKKELEERREKREEEERLRKEKKEEEKKKREEERKAKEEARKKEREAKKKAREEEKKRREEARKNRKKRGRNKRKTRKRTDDKKEDVTNVQNEENKEDKETIDIGAEEVKDEVSTSEIEKEESKAEDKDKEEKVEDDIKPYDPEKDKDDKPKDKTAYSRGLVWYAKTMVQRDKLSSAGYLLKRMRDDGGLSDDASREIPVVLADIAIKEKNYQRAIIELDQAIELANKKRLKARYAYVKAQLLEKERRYTEAGESYRQAKKWARDFEMEFMAELNEEKMNMLGGGKSTEGVIARLDKMLKESKYDEYLDRLYYTKGEILLADNKFSEALANFRLSISNNKGNKALQQETYYRLATLLYEKEAYVDASNYFDSTLTVLSKDDARYNEVEKYALNLKDIAKNIETIALQDSMLMMASLSDEELKEIAKAYYEEEKNNPNPETRKVESRKSSGLIDGSKSNPFASSSFFAYDQQAKLRGEREFDRVWGDIALSDNWRRSNRSGIFESENPEIANEEKVAEGRTEEDEIEDILSAMKAEIPYAQKDKDRLNEVLSTAYFELGKLYREKIQNYERSAQTHETLLNRYPDFDQKLEVYYYLYLTYLDLGDQMKSNEYKKKISEEFPDTEYAKLINNPLYAASRLSEEEKLDRYYEKMYQAFQDGNYQLAFDQAEQSSAIFGKDNELRPKFELVRAMAIGNLKGKEEYMLALRNVANKFPNSPEKIRAEEMLRFLGGDEDAFSGIQLDEAEETFTLEEDKLHYVAVVLEGVPPEVIIETKILISNYNKEYHRQEKLQMGDATLNRETKTEVILVKRFDNKDKAMRYYDGVQKSLNEFIPEAVTDYGIYPVSQQNYRRMFAERSADKYEVFFNKYYLGK